MSNLDDHLSKEADRLQNDPIFIEVLKAIRSETLDALATADADDKTMILRLQQRAAVIDEIRNVLSRFILNGKVDEGDASPYA